MSYLTESHFLILSDSSEGLPVYDVYGNSRELCADHVGIINANVQTKRTREIKPLQWMHMLTFY